MMIAKGWFHPLDLRKQFNMDIESSTTMGSRRKSFTLSEKGAYRFYIKPDLNIVIVILCNLL